MADDASWKVATRRSRRIAGPSLSSSKILGSFFPSKDIDETTEFKRLSAALSRHLRELSYCSALCTTICESIQSSLSNDVVEQDIIIDCIGLGSVVSSASSNSNSVVQLAFLILLSRIATLLINRSQSINRELLCQDYEEVERLHEWEPTQDLTIGATKRRRVHVWEPLFSKSDIRMLNILGFDAFATPWNSRDDVRLGSKDLVILYMPHCPMRLYSIALRRFWGSDLERLVLIGNTMGEQDTSKLGKSDCVQRLLELTRKSINKEDDQDTPSLTISTTAIEELVSRRAVGDLSYIFGPPMSSTSLHTFHLLASCLGKAPPEPDQSSLSIEEE